MLVTELNRKDAIKREKERQEKKAFWMLMSRDLDITNGQSSRKHTLDHTLFLAAFLIIFAARWSLSW